MTLFCCVVATDMDRRRHEAAPTVAARWTDRQTDTHTDTSVLLSGQIRDSTQASAPSENNHMYIVYSEVSSACILRVAPSGGAPLSSKVLAYMCMLNHCLEWDK